MNTICILTEICTLQFQPDGEKVYPDHVYHDLISEMDLNALRQQVVGRQCWVISEYLISESSHFQMKETESKKS